jgi:hypothetical protein
MVAVVVNGNRDGDGGGGGDDRNSRNSRDKDSRDRSSRNSIDWEVEQIGGTDSEEMMSATVELRIGVTAEDI